MNMTTGTRAPEPTPRTAESRSAARAAAFAAQGSDRRIALLEREWGAYKYAVLERSPRIYQSIRGLLRDKTGYPVAEFYRLVDLALATPCAPQMRANAAAHVWGYFKRVAAEAEKREYRDLMASYLDGEAEIGSVKRFLWRLSVAYGVGYLIGSDYFADR
ncbi:MAG: YbgA family protein [Candidatus Izemoplasmatales bacterium]